MQNAKCKIQNTKCKMQNAELFYLLYFTKPKIVNYEIIFVQGEATNPQHSVPM